MVERQRRAAIADDGDAATAASAQEARDTNERGTRSNLQRQIGDNNNP